MFDNLYLIIASGLLSLIYGYIVSRQILSANPGNKKMQEIASAIQIGAPVSIKKAVRVLEAFDGIVEEATEGELANVAAKANRTGLLCCPHTGVALAVLEKLLQKGMIKKNNRTVVISTANGLKFTDFLYKYHTNKIRGVESKYAHQAMELPPDYEKVRKAILKKLPPKN